MTEAAQVIAALRAEQAALAALVAGLDEADLTHRSGAAEWTVADVLSHLGSGAEINLATLNASVDGIPAATQDDNQVVWDRWNAMTPAEQAAGFVAADAALVERYESLLPQQDSVSISLAYLPFPLTLAQAARLRLSEAALHSWDVRVAADPAAALTPATAAALLHGEPNFIGWTAKPDTLGGDTGVVRVRTTDPDSVFALHLESPVRVELGEPADAGSTLDLSAEAWLRLVAGRLAADHTPADTVSTGPLSLDRLRPVFPGY